MKIEYPAKVGLLFLTGVFSQGPGDNSNAGLSLDANYYYSGPGAGDAGSLGPGDYGDYSGPGIGDSLDAGESSNVLAETDNTGTFGLASASDFLNAFNGDLGNSLTTTEEDAASQENESLAEMTEENVLDLINEQFCQELLDLHRESLEGNNQVPCNDLSPTVQQLLEDHNAMCIDVDFDTNTLYEKCLDTMRDNIPLNRNSLALNNNALRAAGKAVCDDTGHPVLNKRFIPFKYAEDIIMNAYDEQMWQIDDTFYMKGQTFSYINVNVNGPIHLGDQGPNFMAHWTSPLDYPIQAWTGWSAVWTDLDPAKGGEVYYHKYERSNPAHKEIIRRCSIHFHNEVDVVHIITFYRMAHFKVEGDCQDGATFQYILAPRDDIKETWVWMLWGNLEWVDYGSVAAVNSDHIDPPASQIYRNEAHQINLAYKDLLSNANVICYGVECHFIDCMEGTDDGTLDIQKNLWCQSTVETVIPVGVVERKKRQVGPGDEDANVFDLANYAGYGGGAIDYNDVYVLYTTWGPTRRTNNRLQHKVYYEITGVPCAEDASAGQVHYNELMALIQERYENNDELVVTPEGFTCDKGTCGSYRVAVTRTVWLDKFIGPDANTIDHFSNQMWRNLTNTMYIAVDVPVPDTNSVDHHRQQSIDFNFEGDCEVSQPVEVTTETELVCGNLQQRPNDAYWDDTDNFYCEECPASGCTNTNEYRPDDETTTTTTTPYPTTTAGSTTTTPPWTTTSGTPATTPEWTTPEGGAGVCSGGSIPNSNELLLEWPQTDYHDPEPNWPGKYHPGGMIVRYCPDKPLFNGTCYFTFPEDKVAWMHVFNAHIRSDPGWTYQRNVYRFNAPNQNFEMYNHLEGDIPFEYVINFRDHTNFTVDEIEVTCESTDVFTYTHYSFPQNFLAGTTKKAPDTEQIQASHVRGTVWTSTNFRTVTNYWAYDTYLLIFPYPVADLRFHDERINFELQDGSNEVWVVTNIPKTLREVWIDFVYDEFFASNELMFTHMT